MFCNQEEFLEEQPEKLYSEGSYVDFVGNDYDHNVGSKLLTEDSKNYTTSVLRFA